MQTALDEQDAAYQRGFSAGKAVAAVERARLAAEVERLRSALINLNAAVDAMWNDHFRSATNHWPSHETRICAAQKDARAALSPQPQGGEG